MRPALRGHLCPALRGRLPPATRSGGLRAVVTQLRTSTRAFDRILSRPKGDL